MGSEKQKGGGGQQAVGQTQHPKGKRGQGQKKFRLFFCGQQHLVPGIKYFCKSLGFVRTVLPRLRPPEHKYSAANVEMNVMQNICNSRKKFSKMPPPTLHVVHQKSIGAGAKILQLHDDFFRG